MSFTSLECKKCRRNCLIIPKWHPPFVFIASLFVNSFLRGDNQVTKSQKVNGHKQRAACEKIKAT